MNAKALRIDLEGFNAKALRVGLEFDAKAQRRKELILKTLTRRLVVLAAVAALENIIFHRFRDSCKLLHMTRHCTLIATVMKRICPLRQILDQFLAPSR